MRPDGNGRHAKTLTHIYIAKKVAFGKKYWHGSQRTFSRAQNCNLDSVVFLQNVIRVFALELVKQQPRKGGSCNFRQNPTDACHLSSEQSFLHKSHAADSAAVASSALTD